MTEDAILAKRFLGYCAREKGLEALSSSEPVGVADIDLYVLPVERLHLLLEDPSWTLSCIPIIAYGDPSALRGAFLAGCADYLREPWSIEELALRARRLISLPRLCLRGIPLRLSEGSVATRFGRAELTFPEQRILLALLRHKGSVVPRSALQCALWGRLPQGRSRVVDVHVSSLRRKLRRVLPSGEAGPLIRAVKGIGYLVCAEEAL